LRDETDLYRVARFFIFWISLAVLAVLVYSIPGYGFTIFRPLPWAFASLVGGAGLGFLFGVPKVLQAPASAGSQAAGNNAASTIRATYALRVNTNLEEISDWLTKIIVGLGLVQLKEIPPRFWQLAERASQSFGVDSVQYVSAAAAIIVMFSVGGFLGGYLMTRLYLQGAIGRADSEMNVIHREVEEARRIAKAAEFAATEGGVQRKPENGSEDALAEWNSDPYKGYADGKNAANGRVLAATIAPASGSEDICRVHLTVSSTDPNRPLDGTVVFHLHPTFKEQHNSVPVGPEGRAELDLLSAGVFTVGVDVDDGNTKLELDLSRIEGGTELFYAR
jgi:hypothetical protein